MSKKTVYVYNIWQFVSFDQGSSRKFIGLTLRGQTLSRLVSCMTYYIPLCHDIPWWSLSQQPTRQRGTEVCSEALEWWYWEDVCSVQKQLQWSLWSHWSTFWVSQHRNRCCTSLWSTEQYVECIGDRETDGTKIHAGMTCTSGRWPKKFLCTSVKMQHEDYGWYETVCCCSQQANQPWWWTNVHEASCSKCSEKGATRACYELWKCSSSLKHF